MKEYLIVYIKESYDYAKEESIKEIKNIYIEAKSKKEAILKSSLEFEIILNIIELEKID